MARELHVPNREFMVYIRLLSYFRTDCSTRFNRGSDHTSDAYEPGCGAEEGVNSFAFS